MIAYKPKSIFIYEKSRDSEIAENVMRFYSDVPVHIVDTPTLDFKTTSIQEGKRHLFLTEHRGNFLKICPGKKGQVCCNYFIVNLGYNCHMGCTYCYLQEYLNNQVLCFYTNLTDLFQEIESAIPSNSEKTYRIGTGEVMDSLALDDATGITNQLIPFVLKSRHNIQLELKTKTNTVDNLLKFNPKEKVVVSWSINPPHIVKTEEYKTATLEERVNAAKTCVLGGYKIGFHMDPIIHYENWKKDYLDLVDYIFNEIPTENIAWISMGTLRFKPELKTKALQTFKQSRIFYEEFVRCQDGKMRILKPIRKELFNTIGSHIIKRSPTTKLYLCMEHEEVWHDTLGFNTTQTTLSDMFAPLALANP